MGGAAVGAVLAGVGKPFFNQIYTFNTRFMMRFGILSFILLALLSCHKQVELSTEAEDLFFVRSEGASMPVWVKGNTASKVFIVLVHGGPGGEAIRSYTADGEIRPLLERYAVAFWDQRNSGSAQGNNRRLTVAQFGEDLERVILSLKYQYGEDLTIFLYSHSWGGAVAPAFLCQGTRQDMIKGWINVGGAHNFPMNDTSAQQMLIREAQLRIAQGEELDFWSEVLDYCQNHDPRNNLDVAIQINQYAHAAEGKIGQINVPEWTYEPISGQPTSLLATLINPASISLDKDFWDELLQLNFSPELYKITVPFLGIWGRYDFVVPYTLGLDLMQHLSSSDKQMLLFDASGHSPMMNQPQEFHQELIQFIERHR